MSYSDHYFHQKLSILPGDTREIFIEKSTDTTFRIVNGRFEPMGRSETCGVSLLQTSGTQRYFRAQESLDDLDEFFDMGSTLDLPIHPVSWSPKWLSYECVEKDSRGDIEKCTGFVRLASEKYLHKYPWISSYVVGGGFWNKSYIAVTSRTAGGSDSQYQYRLFLMLTGSRDDIQQEYYQSITGVDDTSRLSQVSIDQLFETSIARLDELLSAPVAPSGEMDIVIASEAGGVIIHEAVGHGLEGDLQGSSVYAKQIGQKVAHEKVSIIDDPTLPGLRGFYRVDHEGNPAEKAVLIENGILKNYLQQESSADFLSLPKTGHARKQTYEYETIVRMGNTYMAPGKDKPEDIIASVQDGLYVTSMGGGQVNTSSGDFVFKVQHARRIRNGVLAEVVRGANLAGNGPKMLQDVSMVGDDLGHFHGGTCGKDGQHMPVTDATPTIKVRLKVTG